MSFSQLIICYLLRLAFLFTGFHQRHPSQDTLSSLRRSVSGSKIRWVDRGTSDAYEIKVYEIDNVDSLQRRGKAGNKVISKNTVNI